MLTRLEKKRFAAAFIGLAALAVGSIFLTLPKAGPLDDFVAALAAQTMNLKLGDSVDVALPRLSDNQLLVAIEAPYRGEIEDRRGLSDKTMRRMLDEQLSDGANRTVLYLIQDGEIRYEQTESRCNMGIVPSTGLRIIPARKVVRARCERAWRECPSPKNDRRWNPGCTIVLSVQ